MVKIGKKTRRKKKNFRKTCKSGGGGKLDEIKPEIEPEIKAKIKAKIKAEIKNDAKKLAYVIDRASKKPDGWNRVGLTEAGKRDKQQSHAEVDAIINKEIYNDPENLRDLLEHKINTSYIFPKAMSVKERSKHHGWRGFAASTAWRAEEKLLKMEKDAAADTSDDKEDVAVPTNVAGADDEEAEKSELNVNASGARTRELLKVDSNGNTPLLYAVKYNTSDVKGLTDEIKQMDDVSKRDILKAIDGRGNTALLYAVKHSGEDIVESLIDVIKTMNDASKRDVLNVTDQVLDETALKSALRPTRPAGGDDKVKFLTDVIDKIDDDNIKHDILNAKTTLGYTPLLYALRYGTEDKVKLLTDVIDKIDNDKLKHDIWTTTEKYGNTALLYAVKYNTYTAVKILINAINTINNDTLKHDIWTTTDKNEHTALEYSRWKKKDKFIQLLTDAMGTSKQHDDEEEEEEENSESDGGGGGKRKKTKKKKKKTKKKKNTKKRKKTIKRKNTKKKKNTKKRR